MNIFVTSRFPRRAVASLDDRRVRKMILEYAQLLSNDMHKRGLKAPLKPKQTNHPLNKWVACHALNYWWLFFNYSALINEYTLRTGNLHSYAKLFTQLYHGASGKYPPVPVFFTEVEFANYASSKLLGLNFRDVTPVWKAYRRYLSARWDCSESPPKWSNRNPPKWYVPKRKKKK